MPDKRTIPPASTLGVLQSVPESALRRMKQYSGRLATEAVHALEERLPGFADLEASQRASVQLVVQNITNRHGQYQYRISTGGGNPCTCDTGKNLMGRMVSLIVTKQW